MYLHVPVLNSSPIEYVYNFLVYFAFCIELSLLVLINTCVKVENFWLWVEGHSYISESD